MNSSNQKRFMYLFERVNEPLYYGPKGMDNMMYMVPMDGMDSRTQDASSSTRADFVSKTTPVIVNRPKTALELLPIYNLCPKNDIYSHFNENHLEGALRLRRALMDEKLDLDDFFNLACTCRDSAMINPRLWIFAVAGAALQRKDMKGFHLPAFWEIAPDAFINGHTIKMAEQQAAMPEKDRSIIDICMEFAGTDANPENRLAYFREDMGINSHHWHWHLVYPAGVTLADAGNKQDRRGELFYYMHHSMLARYNAERFANGLPKVLKLEIKEGMELKEGYFPKLVASNSGVSYAGRQENTKLNNIDRQDLTSSRFIDLDSFRQWKDRISSAIAVGNVHGTNGETIKLTIDILGNMLEPAMHLSPNLALYGRIHNTGHVVISQLHDPRNRHKEPAGVMTDTTTAMRDPVFYRWHTYIDEICDEFKQKSIYENDLLKWDGITVEEFKVQCPNLPENRLTTFWMKTPIDLARGLDLRRDNMRKLGSVKARFTHLNHDDFKYVIKVHNSGPRPVDGTVRIFMAPRFNEQGRRFNMAQQRLLFFEMDKFTEHLRVGANVFERSSIDSTITIPWAQTFDRLERDMDNPTAARSVCGCGWPHHMLLPRGTQVGMEFDLYVIITDSEIDRVEGRLVKSESQKQGCKEAMSFCGILDNKYPDKRDMGFPFDRRVPGRMSGGEITLEEFTNDVPNSKAIQVKIRNLDKTVLNPIDDVDPTTPIIVSNPSCPPVMDPVTPVSPVPKPKPGKPEGVESGKKPGHAEGSGKKYPPGFIPTKPIQWKDRGRWNPPNSGRRPGWTSGRESREASPSPNNGWTWI